MASPHVHIPAAGLGETVLHKTGPWCKTEWGRLLWFVVCITQAGANYIKLRVYQKLIHVWIS